MRNCFTFCWKAVKTLKGSFSECERVKAHFKKKKKRKVKLLKDYHVNMSDDKRLTSSFQLPLQTVENYWAVWPNRQAFTCFRHRISGEILFPHDCCRTFHFTQLKAQEVCSIFTVKVCNWMGKECKNATGCQVCQLAVICHLSCHKLWEIIVDLMGTFYWYIFWCKANLSRLGRVVY